MKSVEQSRVNSATANISRDRTEIPAAEFCAETLIVVNTSCTFGSCDAERKTLQDIKTARIVEMAEIKK